MMIDGERIPSPEGDVRNVALDVIPADLLEAIEVSKALTPDQDGDAIGGSVNLVMKEAAREPRLSVSLAAGYNELSDDTAEKASFTMSRRLNQDRLGIILSGSYLNTDRASENFEVAYDDGELDELEYRDYEINRERIGLGLALDYEPDLDHEYSFKATWNRFDDQEHRRRVRNRVGDERMEREVKDRFESQTIYSLSAKGRRTFGNASSLSYRLSYACSEEDEPDRLDTTFRQKDVSFDPNVSPTTIDPDNIRANPLDEDLSAYKLDDLAFEDNLTTERDVVARLDYEMPHGGSGGLAGLLKLGAKYRDKSKERNNEVTVYETDEDVFLVDLLDGGYAGDAIVDGRYPMGRFFTIGGARGLLRRPDIEGEKDWEEETADYDAQEEVLAVYVSDEIYLNEALMLLPGLRWEHSEVDYTGYEVLFDTEGDLVSKSPVNGRKDLDLLLPHLHLRYRLDESSNLRVALTRSFARPSFGDLAPCSLILEEDLEIERGNPDLEVSTSWNLDLMYEHFFSSVGLVSAGVFVKRIDDYIYDLRFDEARSGEVFEVIQPRNGDSADLWGLELAYQNQLRFLPDPFDGLGLYLNYTYTDSEASFPERQGAAATLPGQSEHVANVALSYEKAGFSGQISLNYHGKYLDEVGEDSSTDIYYDDHSQLDLSTSYRISPKVRLFLELNNLTDEPLRYYEGSSNRPIQEEYYSWWGLIGFSYDL
jgi:TonB-dependent receptor